MNTLKPATWLALFLALASIIAPAWMAQTPERSNNEPAKLVCSGDSGNNCGGGPG